MRGLGSGRMDFGRCALKLRLDYRRGLGEGKTSPHLQLLPPPLGFPSVLCFKHGSGAHLSCPQAVMEGQVGVTIVVAFGAATKAMVGEVRGVAVGARKRQLRTNWCLVCGFFFVLHERPLSGSSRQVAQLELVSPSGHVGFTRIPPH